MWESKVSRLPGKLSHPLWALAAEVAWYLDA